MPTAAQPMLLRLVLDTNTVLALWMFRDPRLATLSTRIDQGDCLLCSRDDALEELRHVLAYPQFGLDVATQQGIWLQYRQRLTLTAAPRPPATPPLPLCRDPDDQKFLEIARSAGATALITRDKALLRLARHRLIRTHFAILSPEAFLDETLQPAGAATKT